MELIARDLHKRYGRTVALAGVSLRAGPGILALLGPNGSGKSTLLRLLATVTRPDSGAISFGGRSYTDDLRPVRRVLGYLPQNVELPGHLTPLALLNYMAGLKETEPDPHLLDQVGLADVAHRPLSALSDGQVKRAAIAQALLGAPRPGAPRLLVLDEPTAGLDPEERDRVLKLLTRPGTGRVVVVSSHIPGEVEHVADQVVVLRRGQVLFAGDVPSLRRIADGQVFEVRAPASEAERWLDRCCISRMTQRGDTISLRLVGEAPAGAVPVAPSLEDAYLLLQRRG